MATQTEYVVPGGSATPVAINNTSGTPHMWMTPAGVYINESTSTTPASTATPQVIIGGS